jgi:NitT/TauT family transport system permease protein
MSTHDPRAQRDLLSPDAVAQADPGTLEAGLAALHLADDDDLGHKEEQEAGAPPTQNRDRKATLRHASILFLERLGFGALLIGLWALAAELEIFDPLVISNPGDVASYLRDAVTGDELWSNLWATLWATLLAFGLASVVGIVIGISLALLPHVERIVSPFLDAANAMPRIAFAPIFVIAFGLTTSAKVALAFTVVVFILITSARAGVRSVDVDIMRLATVLGANRRHMFRKVLLPVATPAIFGGLRLAVIYSLLGVVTSEIIAAKNGMGQLLQEYAGTFRTDAVYGILIVLAVVAVLLNIVMNRVERYFLRWQPTHTH